MSLTRPSSRAAFLCFAVVSAVAAGLLITTTVWWGGDPTAAAANNNNTPLSPPHSLLGAGHSGSGHTAATVATVAPIVPLSPSNVGKQKFEVVVETEGTQGNVCHVSRASFIPIAPVDVEDVTAFLKATLLKRCPCDNPEHRLPSSASSLMMELGSASARWCLQELFRGVYDSRDREQLSSRLNLASASAASLHEIRMVPTEAADWTAALVTLVTEDLSTPSFSLFVLRHHVTSEAPAARVPLSNNSAEWEYFIRNVAGPDELHGMADLIAGHRSTMYPVGFMHLGFDATALSHVYLAFLPQLTVQPRGEEGGVSYRIRVLHEFDDFWALNDHQSTILRHRHRMVVDTSLPANQRETLSKSAAKTRSSSWWCRVYGEGRGVFWRGELEGANAHVRDHPRPYDPIRGADVFRWGPPRRTPTCAERGNQPFMSPSLDGPDHVVKHLNGIRRVLFTGDSQVRSLFRHWVAVYHGVPVNTSKTFNLTLTSSKRQPSPWTTTFLWDAYLHRMCGWTASTWREVRRDFDAVIFGFGSWPASYGQWTLQQFAAHAERCALSIHRNNHNVPSDDVNRSLPLIFVGSPAWPKFRKHNPGFRISNTRLHVYNQLMTRALLLHRQSSSGERSGVRVSPLAAFFDFSFALPKMRRKDDMHYDGSVVVFATVDAITSAIGAVIDT